MYVYVHACVYVFPCVQWCVVALCPTCEGPHRIQQNGRLALQRLRRLEQKVGRAAPHLRIRMPQSSVVDHRGYEPLDALMSDGGRAGRSRGSAWVEEVEQAQAQAAHAYLVVGEDHLGVSVGGDV
jgi:hypothetical protein